MVLENSELEEEVQILIQANDDLKKKIKKLEKKISKLLKHLSDSKKKDKGRNLASDMNKQGL